LNRRFFIRRRHISSCKITIFEGNFFRYEQTCYYWKQFDLAHGLPLRIKIIDDYWKNIKDSNHDELVAFDGSYAEFNGHNNLNDLIDIIT
jgi:hypothetical protein